MKPSQCPHANHVGTTVPHEELLQICSICGGPRIHGEAHTSGGEVEALRAAKDAYTRRTAWRIGAGCNGVFASLAALLGVLFARSDAAWLVTIGHVFLALGAPFALVFVAGLFRSAAYSKKLVAAIERAWHRAVRDVASGATEPILAAALAQHLGASEEKADQWLIQLSAEGLLRSDVTEDGQIVYVPAQRLRIGTPGGAPPIASAHELSSDAALEARFAALDDRESQSKH